MAKKVLLCSIVIVLNFFSFSAAELGWWEDASLYQIYPRSFKDNDGDGVGDLKGITSKLDYLKDIGITAAWLSPIYKSPMSDFGYDISDFYDIDPLYGNLDDFDALIAKAKSIGLKIILDFVPNHSSDECIWFQKSVNRTEGYENFYVWADGRGEDPENPGKQLPPSNWTSDFGGTAWTWNDQRQQFFLHQFQPKQPDLNFRDENARATMLNVLKFWLDRGIDGFRIDAIPYFFETLNENGTYTDEPVSGETSDPNSNKYLKHLYTRDQPENVGLIAEWRQFVDNYTREHGGDERILFAEAYSPLEALDNYFGNETHPAAHFPFNFDLMYLNKDSNARDLEDKVNNWMDTIWKKHKSANWVIGNHDNPRIGDRIGKDNKDNINMVVLALPGSPVTYNGEEIGMDDVPDACSNDPCDFRDPERTPFQWDNTTSAGFSDSNKTWLPVAKDYKCNNVKIQQGQERSSLNIYKGMQKLKTTAAFKAFKEEGAWKYGALNDQVFQIIRNNTNEEYRILVNLGSDLETVGPLCNSIDTSLCFMEYKLVTKNSPHNIGDLANLTSIQLTPHEGIVLGRTTE
ncbi:maltase A2-like [Episyrphus balteatus]|uniref:maltase A2-like n=1 Tax=Episyrphus balteatus TaxID=286459 RepID=UPI002485E66C|nr:maltase A2-like [Episyrphus balteatus]